MNLKELTVQHNVTRITVGLKQKFKRTVITLSVFEAKILSKNVWSPRLDKFLMLKLLLIK